MKEHTSFLSASPMRILFAADDDGVDGDEDCEHKCQDRLDGNQYHARHGLSGLRDAKLLHEDEDADNREYPDDLDDGINPIAGLRHVGSPEEHKNRHERLDDELSGGLR